MPFQILLGPDDCISASVELTEKKTVHRVFVISYCALIKTHYKASPSLSPVEPTLRSEILLFERRTTRSSHWENSKHRQEGWVRWKMFNEIIKKSVQESGKTLKYNSSNVTTCFKTQNEMIYFLLWFLFRWITMRRMAERAKENWSEKSYSVLFNSIYDFHWPFWFAALSPPPDEHR